MYVRGGKGCATSVGEQRRQVTRVTEGEAYMHVEKRVHDERERVRGPWGPGGNGEKEAHCVRGGCVYRGVQRTFVL